MPDQIDDISSLPAMDVTGDLALEAQQKLQELDPTSLDDLAAFDAIIEKLKTSDPQAADHFQNSERQGILRRGAAALQEAGQTWRQHIEALALETPAELQPPGDPPPMTRRQRAAQFLDQQTGDLGILDDSKARRLLERTPGIGPDLAATRTSRRARHDRTRHTQELLEAVYALGPSMAAGRILTALSASNGPTSLAETMLDHPDDIHCNVVTISTAATRAMIRPDDPSDFITEIRADALGRLMRSDQDGKRHLIAYMLAQEVQRRDGAFGDRLDMTFPLTLERAVVMCHAIKFGANPGDIIGSGPVPGEIIAPLLKSAQESGYSPEQLLEILSPLASETITVAGKTVPNPLRAAILQSRPETP